MSNNALIHRVTIKDSVKGELEACQPVRYKIVAQIIWLMMMVQI